MKRILLLISLFILIVHATASAATYLVTSREDSGPNTLRAAIAASNTTTGMQLIEFAIPGNNSITVYSPLIISHPVTIDGKKVQVLGGIVSNYDYLMCVSATAQGSIIKNLALVGNWPTISSPVENGMMVYANNTAIRGCAIGTDWSDSSGRGFATGLFIANCNDVVIGGTTPAERNIIAGNSINLQAEGTIRLKITGNYVGVASNGSNPIMWSVISQSNAGIAIMNSAVQTMIGGNSNLGEGNLISGNRQFGITVYSSGNSICGNVIGLNANQTDVIPNQNGAVLSSGNMLGLPQLGFGNVISGNTGHGASVGSRSIVQNNLVGISSNGVKMANGATGIGISGNDVLIGGNLNANHYQRNVISGNAVGIGIGGSGNIVSGNLIGTDLSGLGPLGNTTGISMGGYGNMIGGSNADPNNFKRNIISGQILGHGIFSNAGRGNTIQGNFIGLNINGDGAVGNAIGISVGNTATCIGSTDSYLRNIISGNTDAGIECGADHHAIIGNYFGLDASGTSVIPNQNAAIRLNNAVACKVGGTVPLERNYICGNNSDGILVTGSNAAGNTIVGNWIGMLPGGTASPRMRRGVSLGQGAHHNAIGIRETMGNLIVNTVDALTVSGTASAGNAFYCNTICAFSNSGITLYDGSNQNKAAPAIYSTDSGQVNGTASPNDYIQLFQASQVSGARGGSLRYLFSTTADSSGLWQAANTTEPSGVVICALATDDNKNSSAFSLNVVISGPTPTPTPEPTATPTPPNTPTPLVIPDGFQGEMINHRSFYVAPNPTKGVNVNFRFFLKQAAEVEIRIYTPQGSHVLTKPFQFYPQGWNTTIWNASGMANGVYFYIAEAKAGGVAEKVKKTICLIK